MPLPKFVTFTGVDDKTSFDRIKELSGRYPIEWGVLFGDAAKGNRYINAEIRTEAMHLPSNVRFAAHLCGEYAQNAMKGIGLSGSIPYSRVQVNAGKYDPQALIYFTKAINKPVIFQCRAKEFPEPLMPVESDSHYLKAAVYQLSDLSGGKGKIPAFRPKQESHMPFVGFAGGIGPDNVLDILNEIKAHNFWIDMETKVRTDDWFDLDKCESVCQQIWGEIMAKTEAEKVLAELVSAQQAHAYVRSLYMTPYRRLWETQDRLDAAQKAANELLNRKETK